MPETGIGFFPDIGGGWFLPRMPGLTGLYLGLTGRVCNRADAYYAGAVTHCVPSSAFETVKAALIEGEPVDAVLEDLHEDPGDSLLAAHREPIDRIFHASSLKQILRNLEANRAPFQHWAQDTLNTLSKKSPLSLKVTFEQLRRGNSYRSLKEALVAESGWPRGSSVCRTSLRASARSSSTRTKLRNGSPPAWARSATPWCSRFSNRSQAAIYSLKIIGCRLNTDEESTFAPR